MTKKAQNISCLKLLLPTNKNMSLVYPTLYIFLSFSCPWNDLLCVELDVKLYTLTFLSSGTQILVNHWFIDFCYAISPWLQLEDCTGINPLNLMMIIALLSFFCCQYLMTLKYCNILHCLRRKFWPSLNLVHPSVTDLWCFCSWFYWFSPNLFTVLHFWPFSFVSSSKWPIMCRVGH